MDKLDFLSEINLKIISFEGMEYTSKNQIVRLFINQLTTHNTTVINQMSSDSIEKDNIIYDIVVIGFPSKLSRDGLLINEGKYNSTDDLQSLMIKDFSFMNTVLYMSYQQFYENVNNQNKYEPIINIIIDTIYKIQLEGVRDLRFVYKNFINNLQSENHITYRLLEYLAKDNHYLEKTHIFSDSQIKNMIIRYNQNNYSIIPVLIYNNYAFLYEMLLSVMFIDGIDPVYDRDRLIKVLNKKLSPERAFIFNPDFDLIYNSIKSNEQDFTKWDIFSIIDNKDNIEKINKKITHIRDEYYYGDCVIEHVPNLIKHELKSESFTTWINSNSDID